MAYARTTWVSGETPLSAQNMNNIEDGIGEVKTEVAIADQVKTLATQMGWSES